MAEAQFRLPIRETHAAATDEARTIDPGLIGLRLVAMLEQLAAMRLDLIHGILPRAERMNVTRSDLEYLMVQLDAAIAAGRGIAACLGPPAASSATREAWRSEDTYSGKARPPS